MLRAMIDQVIAFAPSSIVIALAHVGALAWALLRRGGMTPVLVLNVAMAAGILAYNGQGIGRAVSNEDWGLLALIAFALANLLCSGAALFGMRVPRQVLWVGFGVDLALSVLLVAFMFLFKINRLI
ncbi:MAG: hypothetical protein PSV22_06775 [Pseudolabrys sp.]|nr:hypothetical protein [Pseudolabrys sp.]